MTTMGQRQQHWHQQHLRYVALSQITKRLQERLLRVYKATAEVAGLLTLCAADSCRKEFCECSHKNRCCSFEPASLKHLRNKHDGLIAYECPRGVARMRKNCSTTDRITNAAIRTLSDMAPGASARRNPSFLEDL